MKRYHICFAFALVLSLTACEDLLDPKVDKSYGDEFTWTLPDKAEGVLLNAYAAIPNSWDNWGDGNFLDAATDNAVTNDFGSTVYRISQGGLTAQTNPIGNWTQAYDQFRNIHLFMEKGLGNPDLDFVYNEEKRNETIKKRLTGESYFLRAWWGMELLRRYGGLDDNGNALGYVIVTKTFTQQELDSVKLLPRNTYEECVAQIVADCDKAITLLPLDYTGSDLDLGSSQIGRASGKAAYALKSRVLTYAASPAFQPIGISDTDRMAKWERAALASFEAITKGAYGAYTTLVATNFNTVATTPPEFLFRKFTENRGMEDKNFPPLFFGKGRTNPSQNLVDAFPAKNGFPITDSRSNYTPQNPYFDRDPRLGLNVYVNNQNFNAERNLEIFNNVTYNSFGKDVAGFEYRNTRTGYYLRKWLSAKPMMLKPNDEKNDMHQHALLRKSEVYYNLAEALNEINGPNTITPSTGSYTSASILREARKQALALVGTDVYLNEEAAKGKEAFRTLIQNERRLEFAFENQRYFDLRRWLLPLNESVRGCRVDATVIGTDPTTKLPIYSFKYFGTDPKDQASQIEVEKRMYNGDKYYYIPLPYEELVKCPNLKDNKGWSISN